MLDRVRNGLARRLRTDESTSNPELRRALILAAHRIDLVFDVGANEGQYAQRLRSMSRYAGQIVSFEPLATAFSALQAAAAGDERWATSNVALSDQAGEQHINAATPTVLSSFLDLRDGASTSTSRELVRVERLDDVAAEYMRPGARVLLKLDVQGFEGHVLRGASDTLPLVDLLECELPLHGLYEGQASFREMVDLITDRGFSPISVHPNFTDPGTGCVSDADYIFRRSTSVS